MTEQLANIAYLLAAALFIFDLKLMAHPRTATRGNLLGALGMLIAIVATLASRAQDWAYIAAGLFLGTIFGVIGALKVPMTAMPEMVALFNGFGGLASVLVAGSALVATYTAIKTGETMALSVRIATVASALIGSVTFFGSYVAFGKLAEFLAVKWQLRPWQAIVKFGFSLLLAALGLWYAYEMGISLTSLLVTLPAIVIAGLTLLKRERFRGMDLLKALTAIFAIIVAIVLIMDPSSFALYWVLAGVAGVLGVLLTWSIGGADMPVVISLLNSYSGLAAAATGFVIGNTVLIVSGSLVGASGIILTNIMCKAMNRSLVNVLFGTLGPTSDTPSADDVYRTVKAASAEEVAMLLDGARRVLIVPGYGLAVSQAQHAIRDLANLLEARGATVEFAIHPVAGRMPGHMNVLLAEADIPYSKLREMDDINPEMEQIDVAIVIGANDVVNPMARTDPKSPIAGMPIIDVDKARNVVVIKRSLSPGFAGIPNPLFAAPNAVMYFGDGKKAVNALIAALKAA